MSTELTCFLFGIPATVLWVHGMKEGVMFGRHTRWVRRDVDPGLFWIFAAFWGMIALGLLITPILSWTGLRE